MSQQCFVTASKKTNKFRNIKGDYENCPTLGSPSEESEAIPVSQLEWYIETNMELIANQYDVCIPFNIIC